MRTLIDTIFFQDRQAKAIPMLAVTEKDCQTIIASNDGEIGTRFAERMHFNGKNGEVLLLPSTNKHNGRAYIAVNDRQDYQAWAKIIPKLPRPNHYYLNESKNYDAAELYALCLGWGMAQYNEQTYRSSTEEANRYAHLALPAQIDKQSLYAELEAIFHTRHLINLPANDMHPEALEKAAHDLAKDYNAEFLAIRGEDLLTQNFPLIHAVGRASQYPPRLLEINHCPSKKPAMSLTLIGKGVCFDSGGLDIKPSSNMLIMKKDMGGAAHVLGLGRLIMQTKLNIQLRILIPAVENAISSNAFRPMDIIKSRSGKTVEVGNTDAEGRLILADALHYASSDKPDLIIDFATLTGAARVALGTEIAAMFANQQNTAKAMLKASSQCRDDLWQLPLHPPYKTLLKSRMADISSTASGGYGGAITAAIFLQSFTQNDTNWIHFDIMAWNNRHRPAHPIGGEAMGIRAVYRYLQNRLQNL